MAYIVALDPGGTTGVCEFDYSDSISDGEFHRFQMDKPDHHSDLLWKLEDYGGELDVVVYEQFTYQRGHYNVDLTAREYIGVVKLYGQLNHVKTHPQMAAQAKKFWTDTKLKTLDLWIPGKPHAMDATRHCLYYITFELKDQTYVKLLK